MSFSEEELKQHCEIILNNRQILNKIIVLCEGTIPKEQGIRSPQSYRKMEQMPDANFYKACTPSSWITNSPVFFTCGNCTNVINTYVTLQKMINKDTKKMTDREVKQLSYYHPKKIFTFIDLDNQIRPIDNYRFKNTQEIFCELYDKGKINIDNNEETHEIFVTGLIYKEAYFFVPALQELFDRYSPQPFYKDNKITLEDIYISMSTDLDIDSNLKANFETACSRISHCVDLVFDDIDKLKNSWLNLFQTTTDQDRKHELIFSLLTVKKIKKDYWEQIHPEGKRSGDSPKYREQMSLAIARDFYAKQTDDEAAAKYHIPYFFKMLRKFA